MEDYSYERRIKHTPSSYNAETNPTATGTRRRSSLISRNLVIDGKRTSARLEPDMWAALFDIVRREGRSAHEVCTLINSNKPDDCTLTAAIRVFIMAYFRSATTEEGHARAGHGYGKILYQAAAPLPRRISLRNGTNGMPWR